MPDHVHLLLMPDLGVADVTRILTALKTRTSTKIAAQTAGESVVSWPAAGFRLTVVRGEWLPDRATTTCRFCHHYPNASDHARPH